MKDDAAEVTRAAKMLLDNRDLAVVMEYLKSSYLNQLTQGAIEDSSDNLRNYRSVELLDHIIQSLAAVKDDVEQDE